MKTMSILGSIPFNKGDKKSAFKAEIKEEILLDSAAEAAEFFTNKQIVGEVVWSKGRKLACETKKGLFWMSSGAEDLWKKCNASCSSKEEYIEALLTWLSQVAFRITQKGFLNCQLRSGLTPHFFAVGLRSDIQRDIDYLAALREV